MINIEDEEYLKLFHKFEQLEKSTNSEQNFNVKINDYVVEAMDLLEKIKDCNGFYDDNEKNDLIFRIIYKIIKLELICSKYKKHSMLDYTLKEESCVLRLSNLIEEDVESIRLSNLVNASLSEKLVLKVEEKREEEDFSYLDKDIIIRIISCYIDEDFREYAKTDLVKTSNEIKNNNDIVKSYIENYSSKLGELTLKVSEKEKNYKNIKRRIISLVLACSLFTGIGFSASKIVKNVSFNQVYEIEVTKNNTDIYVAIIMTIISLFPPCGPINLFYKLIKVVLDAKKENREIERVYFDIRAIIVNSSEILNNNVSLIEFGDRLTIELSKLAGFGYMTKEEINVIRKYNEIKSMDSNLQRNLTKINAHM